MLYISSVMVIVGAQYISVELISFYPKQSGFNQTAFYHVLRVTPARELGVKW